MLAVFVLVELLHHPLDLDRHGEVLAYRGDELLGVDEAAAVALAAERDERVERVELVLELLGAATLLLECPEELRELDLSGPVFVNIRHESEEFFFGRVLPDRLQKQLHLTRVDRTALVLIERVEGLAALLDEVLLEHHRE